jgi:hypothetical protein
MFVLLPLLADEFSGIMPVFSALCDPVVWLKTPATLWENLKG